MLVILLIMYAVQSYENFFIKGKFVFFMLLTCEVFCYKKKELVKFSAIAFHNFGTFGCIRRVPSNFFGNFLI